MCAYVCERTRALVCMWRWEGNVLLLLSHYVGVGDWTQAWWQEPLPTKLSHPRIFVFETWYNSLALAVNLWSSLPPKGWDLWVSTSMLGLQVFQSNLTAKALRIVHGSSRFSKRLPFSICFHLILGEYSPHLHIYVFFVCIYDLSDSINYVIMIVWYKVLGTKTMWLWVTVRS